ncbi:transglycosylase domain-containing protein [Streptosporangium sp. NPDC051022]|uniref:transglycosylase domain-containing protein n=1 Tax=Streptosporangium sp. NPDC051022 TaxID=3155752 RepID=UPI0034380AD8
MRRQEPDPAVGRRPEAAFEDTQAMMAAQAGAGRPSGRAGAPGAGVPGQGPAQGPGQGAGQGAGVTGQGAAPGRSAGPPGQGAGSGQGAGAPGRGAGTGQSAAFAQGAGPAQGGPARDADTVLGSGATGGRGRRARGGRGTTGPGGPQRPTGPGGPGGGDGGPRGPEGPGGPEGRGPGEGRGGKAKRSGWKRFLPSWKIVMASFAVLAAGVFGMIAVAYANTPVPTTTQATVDDRGSVIYYANGTVLARLGVKRTPVTIKDIPVWVQDAVISAENRSFREDSGIDLRGMARSVWSTLSGAQLQGASTITQQMARNYYDGLSQEVSIQRKVKEIFVAIKINKTLSKDEILTRYLNAIYFGRGANGIQAAAKAFFGKNVKDLTPPEAAYIAGRIQNPSTFDTLEANDKFAATKERYQYVLKYMADLNPTAYGKYANVPFESLKFKKVKITEINRGLKGYMLNIVFRELKKRGISEDDLKTKGLRVHTTFDEQKMKDAQKVVQARTANLDSTIHASIASVNPKNGRVVAFYSGDDFIDDYNNRAFDAAKQAASAFKPYVLAAWLESGRSLDSLIDGVSSIELPGTAPIKNSHAAPYGPIDTVKAMADSVNTVFAQMGETVGLKEVARIAKEAGVGERVKDNPLYGGQNSVDWAVDHQKYQTTIGVASVTAVEQAAGYSIFANEGKHVDWHTIIKVTDSKGLVWLPEQLVERQVISPEAAADATYALQAVVKGGTGIAANLGVRPVAGKTGTNNEYKDAWFVGFTPQIVTAVGMSKDVPYNKLPGKSGRRVLKVDKHGLPNRKLKTVYWEEEPMPSFIGGGGTPTQIWHDYMALITAKDKVEQFPERANTGSLSNLATPRPTPSPTETETYNPDDNGDNGMPDVGVTPPPITDCQPGDLSCSQPDDGSGGGPLNGDGTGNGGGFDNNTGVAPGAAVMPTPTPTGQRP